MDAFGLFTGQVGYAWNNALFYLKGGAALTDSRFTTIDTATGIVYPRQPTTRKSAYSLVQGVAIVATVDQGYSLSEHANPLRSVHANRASGATS